MLMLVYIQLAACTAGVLVIGTDHIQYGCTVVSYRFVKKAKLHACSYIATRDII